MTGPVGGAGELTRLTNEAKRLASWVISKREAINLAGIYDRSEAFSAAHEIWRLAALAAKAPQGVPASPVLLDYPDYAKRASGTIHHGPFPPVPLGTPRSSEAPCMTCGRPKPVIYAVNVQACSSCFQPFDTHEAAAPKPAPTDALHVGDELDALAEDIDRNGLMAATPALPADTNEGLSTEQLAGLWPGSVTRRGPAPGAERAAPTWHDLPERERFEKWWIEETTSDICGLDNLGLDQMACIARFAKRLWREALAAAPPAPTKSKWSQDYIDGRESILKLVDGGFGGMPRAQTLELEQLRADRHASAERVRELELTLKNLTLHMGAQLNIIIERSNRQKGSARNRTRRYAGTVEEWLRMAREALPPSTQKDGVK